MNALQCAAFLAFFQSLAQAPRRAMRGLGHAAGALGVVGVLGIAASPGGASAATQVVPAGSHYFSNYTWATFSTATPPDPAVATNLTLVTGGWLAGIPFSVSAPAQGMSNYVASGVWPPSSSFMPANIDYPAGGPQQHALGRAAPVQVTYQFAQAIPLNTHLFIQDVEAAETATFAFKACDGTVIDPSGWDYLTVSTNVGDLSAAFSAANVKISTISGAYSADEPLVAIIMRDTRVCRIDVSAATASGGAWQMYFSVPPTDPAVQKTAGSASFFKGGPVKWTLTASNTSPATSGTSSVANPTQAYGVTITDTVDAAVNGLSAVISNAGGTTGGACTVGAGNAVNCSGFSPLANGASIEVTLSGTLSSGYGASSLANTAALTSAGPKDLNPDNNTSTVQTPISAPPPQPPVQPAPAPAPVPALSEWMLMGLSLLMASLAWPRVRAALRRD